MKNILVATTGSIGAKDTVAICALLKQRFHVRLIASQSSLPFFDVDEARAVCDVYTDDSEWYSWKKRGDAILHIQLREWADAYLIAPLTANTLAKMATGVCDNLVTTTFRAWRLSERPVIVAPSMNKYMWENPITQQQLILLRSWGVHEIAHRVKLLAGGDFGPAALARPESIFEYMCGRFDNTLEAR